MSDPFAELFDGEPHRVTDQADDPPPVVRKPPTRTKKRYTAKTRKHPGIKLRPKHNEFVATYLKHPTLQQSAVYKMVYAEANPLRCGERAAMLLKRADIQSEINRRQSLITAAAAMTRGKMEAALADVFSFDMRKLFYPALDDNGMPHPRAGEPLPPHLLPDDAARALEAYEIKVGRYGKSMKTKTTSRMAAAELLAKLRGWARDEGRPPIIANFQFNFGPRPSSPEALKPIEAVPPAMYEAIGLRDDSVPAAPVRPQVDEHGEPVHTGIPAGYEPARGVRIKSIGTELGTAMDDVARRDSQ